MKHALVFFMLVFVLTSDTLHVRRTEVAPAIDGFVEEIWNEAEPLHVKVLNHHTLKRTNVTLRALYTDTDVFILAVWEDSLADSDMFAFIWNKENSVERFNRRGCWALCHGEAQDPEQFMSANGEGEIADEWLWSSQKTNQGFAADRFLDNATDPYDIDAAHHFDEGLPAFTKDMSQKPTGSSADVEARALWGNGFWTLELKRRLVTGNPDDIQFYPALGKKYHFAFAVWDNERGRHKSVSSAKSLVFEGFLFHEGALELPSYWIGVVAILITLVWIAFVYKQIKGGL